jgi:parvulin-like peptidyl-prolyl cis-trans isomerase-like protein
MVRRLAVFALLLVAGCSGLRDAFSAHQDVVARAAGQQLTVNQLAQLIAPVKQIPLNRLVVDRLADLWVDYQLLGQAAAQGDSLLDSATVMAANWPVAMQKIVDRFHDSIIGARATVTDHQVDSAYNAGNVRWLDHILIRVAQDTTDAFKATKRKVADGLLAQLRRGADFAKLARANSDDPGSKAAGGSLGLVARGQLVKVFEDAAWGLKPGEISAVVASPFGYHIIWRPTLDQVRDSFKVALRNQVVQHLDSAYVDSLNAHTGLNVKGSAAVAARAAAQNMRDAKTNGRVLATYRGGKLTVKEFARWLQAFSPQTQGAVAQAPDSLVNQFIASLARNDMMIQAAQTRHIDLTVADRDTIRTAFRDDLATMETRLGVSAESLRADTTTSGGRSQVAAHQVDKYFTDIVTDPTSRPFFQVPPFLSDVLRGRFAWDISPAGVDRALSKAAELRGPTAPAGVPQMTPAPMPPMGPRSKAPTTPPTRPVR